jgi:hypothetical protein
MYRNVLDKFASGTEAGGVRIEQLMRNSLILVGALTSYKGCERAELILN